MGVANISGNILTDSGASLSSYLPLTGGTLTGALSGTNATFTTGAKIATASGQLLVGSSTSTIGTALEVVGDIYASNKIYASNGTAANPSFRFFAGASGLYTTNGDDLGITTNGASRLFITSSGNVGIGTSSPNYKLQIDGELYMGNNKSIYLANTGIAAGAIRFFNATSGTTKSAIGSYYNIANEGNLEFMTGGENLRMVITSGGTLLVGSSSAAGYKAEFYGGGSYTMLINQSGGNASFPALTVQHNATSGTIYLEQFYAGSTAVGSITSNGSITSYNISSDYRLKQDLKQYNGLNLISAIKTYDYEWKSDKSRMYGVVAHELQEIIPYAVTGEKDGEQMQSVDYSKLVPILVKAIQELKAEIDELKNK